VITTNDVAITYELHVIRAHLLHYTSLLRDFRTSVEFVCSTANPAMDADDIDDATRASDHELLNKECRNLLSEIHRLEMHRKTLDDRVQNVQDLVSTGSEHSMLYILPTNKSLGIHKCQYRGQQGHETSLVHHHDFFTCVVCRGTLSF
jgi:hypothetical protein